MRGVVLAQAAVTVGLNVASGGALVVGLRVGREKRGILLAFLIGVVLASPLLIRPGGAGVLRFVMGAMAVEVAFRLYDLHMESGAGWPSAVALAGNSGRIT